MGVITDLLLAVPIGIIYNMLVHEFAYIFNEKFNYKDKVQKTLLIVFGGGMFGMIIAMFCLSNSVQNTAVKYGLYIGSILLLFHSIFYNWQIMQNDTRIIIMILTLCTLIWFSYTTNSKNDKSTDYTNSDGTKLSQLLPLTYYEQYNDIDIDNHNNHKYK